MSTRNHELVVNFRAGDCVYYKTKHPDLGESYQDQGIMPYARAPKTFVPDIQKLANNPDSLFDLAKIIKNYDESQLRILIKVLHDSSKLIPHGLKFGQPVYFNLSAPLADYVNCWFRCYTVAVGPKHEGTQYIYFTGNLEDVHGSLLLVPRDHVMTASSFKKHVAKLESDGKITAPEIRQHKKLIVHDKYEEDIVNFPSIDEVSEQLKNCSIRHEIEDKPTRTKRKRKSTPSSYEIV